MVLQRKSVRSRLRKSAEFSSPLKLVYFERYLQERIMPIVDRVAAKAPKYMNPKPMSAIPGAASSSCRHMSAA